MKKKKTTKQKWQDKMKEKEPLQCWIVNIISSTNPFRIKDGKGDNKFVITVAPQKLICPKGKT